MIKAIYFFKRKPGMDFEPNFLDRASFQLIITHEFVVI